MRPFAQMWNHNYFFSDKIHDELREEFKKRSECSILLFGYYFGSRRIT